MERISLLCYKIGVLEQIEARFRTSKNSVNCEVSQKSLGNYIWNKKKDKKPDQNKEILKKKRRNSRF